jgi:hypothetical protein
LSFSTNSDSVAATLTSAGANDDGAARSGPRAVSLLLQSRGGVLEDHLVRAIAAVLDLSWVYGELAPYYSRFGRPSLDPALMIRMLFVGYVFAIPRPIQRRHPG